MNNSYFSHDSNARNDEKIVDLRLKHGMEGYGVYFAILERMRENKDYFHVKDYNIIAFDLRVSNALVKSVIEDFGLFQCAGDGSRFYSESFLKRMKAKDDVSKSRSENGRKGAGKRWKIANNEKTMANAIFENGKTMANDVKNDSKESKVKKSKIKKSILSIESIPKEKPPEKTAFEKFNDWIAVNAPYCHKHMKQLSENELEKLKQKYTAKQIADTVTQLENRKDLRKRYSNLYRTILNWLKNETDGK
ncbi:MAG: DUF4373 domain-containing protein [Dysgonamonadaceae bacterium]|jgi:hypothetical protein|nr:DUF4373 domain-containing protein [Dysgonamonadaceae bacterium]